MDKRKKSKFRRRINRIKNKMQYLRKRVCVPVTCFLLCFSLIAVTLFATKQQAYATGVEELFYYTYWDLISGLFAETGYEFSSPDSYYAKPDRASGKDVWDNFCTWVENKAKVLSLPVEVVNDTIFKELENLPNVVNAAGVSMSEALAQLLGTVLPTAATDEAMKNQFDCSSQAKVYDFLVSILGCANYKNLDYLDSVAYKIYANHSLLSVFVSPSGYAYVLLDIPKNTYFGSGATDYYTAPLVYLDSGVEKVLYCNPVTVDPSSCEILERKNYYGVYCNAGAYWLVKNGAFVGVDGTALSDYARVKVKEKTEDRDGVYIPGVGWKTKWNVWDDVLDGQGATDKEKDEWWLRYHVNELLKDLPDSGDVDPDDEKRRKQDNEKDKLPVVLPIPFKPGKDTEKDTEKETESEKDTEPAPGPIPKPNPTEDGSEDDTETKKHIQDVITNAGGSSGGNWKKLFPFCIPWDIMTLIKSMNAEKKAPHFKYEHTFKGINYTFSIDVDMSDYWKYIKIFRWGMTIFFIIGLFFLTVKFTTFVHRGS